MLLNAYLKEELPTAWPPEILFLFILGEDKIPLKTCSRHLGRLKARCLSQAVKPSPCGEQMGAHWDGWTRENSPKRASTLVTGQRVWAPLGAGHLLEDNTNRRHQELP